MLKTKLATGGAGAICNSYTVVRFDEYQATRKALDVAVDALKIIGSGEVIEHSVLFHEDDNKITIANKALKQINEIKGSKDA